MICVYACLCTGLRFTKLKVKKLHTFELATKLLIFKIICTSRETPNPASGEQPDLLSQIMKDLKVLLQESRLLKELEWQTLEETRKKYQIDSLS